MSRNAQVQGTASTGTVDAVRGMADRVQGWLEGEVGPLPDFLRVSLTEGALAAALSIVAAIVGWLVIVGVAAALVPNNSNYLTSFSALGHPSLGTFAAIASLIVAVANTMPVTISVGQGFSLFDLSSIHSSPTILTGAVWIATWIAGRRAARRLTNSWLVGLGVAVVYATALTIFVAVFISQAQLGGSISGTFKLEVWGAWLFALLWGCGPAMIAAGGRAQAVSQASSFLNHPLVQPWRPAIVGSLWAIGVCIGACLAATAVALGVTLANSNFFAAVDPWEMVGLFILFLPAILVYTFTFFLGATVGLSGTVTDPGWGHISLWQSLGWWDALPVIILLGCTAGALKCISIRDEGLNVYRTIIPFTALALLLAWLTTMTAHFQASRSLLGIIHAVGSILGMGMLTSIINARLRTGYSVSFGPNLSEVLLASVLFMALGATIARYVWGPLTGLFAPWTSGPDKSQQSQALTPARSIRAPTSVGVSLGSVRAPSERMTQSDQRRSVCQRCHHQSVGETICPNCGGPLS